MDHILRAWISEYGIPPEVVEATFQASVENAKLLTERDVLQEVCEVVASGSEEAQGIMRREGFVIDDLEDRWQKLAFTFYTMLASLSAKAIAALDANKGEQCEEPIICNACGGEVKGPLQDGLCPECYCIPEMWGEP